MISAFIWCIYCLCRQKIMKFQNFVVSKLKFFVIKLGTFSRLVWKYYDTYGCFQRLCGCLKISAFIWDHFWLIRVTNMHSTAHDICRAESAPPRTIRIPKSPNWIGLMFWYENFGKYFLNLAQPPLCAMIIHNLAISAFIAILGPRSNDIGERQTVVQQNYTVIIV